LFIRVERYGVVKLTGEQVGDHGLTVSASNISFWVDIDTDEPVDYEVDASSGPEGTVVGDHPV
jgi:hypothetical protein